MRRMVNSTYPPGEIKLRFAVADPPTSERGASVRRRQRYLVLGFVLSFVPVSVSIASPASADCTGAGYATVCAQGEVRGGGPTPPSAGTYYPSYCADPWYCDDGWDLDVVIGRPGGPGGIGGGGGIGPRR